MKTITAIAVIASTLALVGCADYTGASSNSYTNIDNSQDYICKDNKDTDCYTQDFSVHKDRNGRLSSVADEPSGEYDPEYTPEECAANGYFWCSIEDRCLNKPADGGTCSGN